MSVQITIELPENAFSTLQSSPEVFVKEMRLAAATKNGTRLGEFHSPKQQR